MPKKVQNQKNISKEKEDSKKVDNDEGFSKAQWIGMIVGFGIAAFIFELGQFGFIPAFIIAYGSYWIVEKIAESILY